MNKYHIISYRFQTILFHRGFNCSVRRKRFGDQTSYDVGTYLDSAFSLRYVEFAVENGHVADSPRHRISISGSNRVVSPQRFQLQIIDTLAVNVYERLQISPARI